MTSSGQSGQVTFNSYQSQLKSALELSLCLRNFPSASVERHNKPEIEIQ